MKLVLNTKSKLKIIDSFIEDYGLLYQSKTIKLIFNDEPKLFMSTTVLGSELFLNKVKNSSIFIFPKNNSIGVSVNKFKKISELKSKAEAIERFFQSLLDKRELIFFGDLNQTNKDTTRFHFGDFFLKEEFINKTPLVKGFLKKSNGETNVIYIPYNLLFLNFLDRDVFNNLLIETNTNGSAFGFTMKEALKNALYEAIEREVVVNAFISKIGMYQINKFSNEVKELIDYFDKYRLKIKIYEFKNHFGLYIIGAFIIDNYSNIFLNFGYKCDDNLNKAIMGAIFEAYHSRIFVKQMYKSFINFKKSSIENIIDSIFFFAKINNGVNLLKELKYIENNTENFEQRNKYKNKKINLNLDFFYYIYNQSLTKNKFFVVKVLIPNFNSFFTNQKKYKKRFNYDKLIKYLAANYKNYHLIYKKNIYRKINVLPIV
jgi:YcaO-like protein with predicted kinase domain